MIYFLIPTYNEEANIPELAKNLLAVSLDEEKFFVFVDDNSSDNTIGTIKKHFQEQHLEVISKLENKGPGDSFNKGFEWILNHSKSDKDKVVTLEADNTSDLNILPTMVMLGERGFDFVLASVYAQGGGFGKTSFFRKFLSFGANFMFRFMYDVKVLTLSSFYRAYSIRSIKKIKTQYSTIINEAGFVCMLEILLKGIKTDATVIEVPMMLKSENRKGKSKMKVYRTMKAYIRFLFFTRLK